MLRTLRLSLRALSSGRSITKRCWHRMSICTALWRTLSLMATPGRAGQGVPTAMESTALACGIPHTSITEPQAFPAAADDGAPSGWSIFQSEDSQGLMRAGAQGSCSAGVNACRLHWHGVLSMLHAEARQRHDLAALECTAQHLHHGQFGVRSTVALPGVGPQELGQASSTSRGACLAGCGCHTLQLLTQLAVCTVTPASNLHMGKSLMPQSHLASAGAQRSSLLLRCAMSRSTPWRLGCTARFDLAGTARPADSHQHLLLVHAARYYGTLRNGCPEGLGSCLWSDGAKYDGEWRVGLMHGFGTYVWKSGQRFDGERKVRAAPAAAASRGGRS
jgi:hypothetical protein